MYFFDDFMHIKRCATSVRSFWRRYRAEISAMCQKMKVSVFEKRYHSVSVGAQHYDLRYKFVPRTLGTSTEVHTTMIFLRQYQVPRLESGAFGEATS